ncbi:MAG: tRNA (adenosine(37)-N6)-dimethylallyltransferase MiaA [Deltaproteobacteria bacterium]|jgi:tRNA dimethylallyltransferase|nr:tRNA (adenosine(37)-N6)-dimethylallyltransferase MiaA [Deltaproteobacteria bacterium]
MNGPKPKAVVITGPTGSGKTRLAVQAGLRLGGEIINADSLAFYRGFNIGAAKASAEEQKLVPHHLLDVADPDQNFDAAAYIAAARPLVVRLGQAGRIPLIAGGTGFYLRSLVRGLFQGPGRQEAIRSELEDRFREGEDLHQILLREDPLAAAQIPPRDKIRIIRALEVIRSSGRSIVSFQKEHRLADRPFRTLILVLDPDRRELEDIIVRRTRAMFSGGLIDEIRNLLAAGWDPGLKPFQAIGYKEGCAHLAGKMTLEEAAELTCRRTIKLVKRQKTFFRGQVPDARWVRPDPAELTDLIKKFWETEDVGR